MTFYIHTDAPDRPRRLPRAWRNVSGLHLLSSEHLAALGWLPWSEAPRPEHDPLHERIVAAVEITATEARRTWSVERRPDAEIPSVAAVAAEAVERIKGECGRVIESTLPLWKQSNMTAEGVKLLDIRRTRPLTEAELARVETLEAAWGWLTRQRTESDRLEALVADYVADAILSDDDKRRAIAALHFAAV